MNADPMRFRVELPAAYQGGYAETPWENDHVRFIFRVWEQSNPGSLIHDHNVSRNLDEDQPFTVDSDAPLPYEVNCPATYVARGRVRAPDGFEMVSPDVVRQC